MNLRELANFERRHNLPSSVIVDKFCRILPKYSPDLNPIEQAFSKFKALLRKASERTIAGLCRRIEKLIAAFSDTECAHFFAHAGYASK